MPKLIIYQRKDPGILYLTTYYPTNNTTNVPINSPLEFFITPTKKEKIDIRSLEILVNGTTYVDGYSNLTSSGYSFSFNKQICDGYDSWYFKIDHSSNFASNTLHSVSINVSTMTSLDFSFNYSFTTNNQTTNFANLKLIKNTNINTKKILPLQDNNLDGKITALGNKSGDINDAKIALGETIKNPQSAKGQNNESYIYCDTYPIQEQIMKQETGQASITNQTLFPLKFGKTNTSIGTRSLLEQ